VQARPTASGHPFDNGVHPGQLDNIRDWQQRFVNPRTTNHEPVFSDEVGRNLGGPVDGRPGRFDYLDICEKAAGDHYAVWLGQGLAKANQDRLVGAAP
jgi:hypothetical protein